MFIILKQEDTLFLSACKKRNQFGISICSPCYYSTIKQNIAQHSATQHNTAQHSTSKRNIAEHSTTQQNIAQHSRTVQHSTTQLNIVQHSAAQRNIGQHMWRERSQVVQGAAFLNLEVPGSNPPPYHCVDLFKVVLSSTPRLRCVNSQLVSLPPVGILNSLCYIFNICLFIYSVPNQHNSAKYIRHFNKVIIIIIISQHTAT